MSWTETDDTELEECYARVKEAQIDLEAKMIPINVIIANASKIKSKQIITYNDKREQIITRIPPKDKWDEDMTDEYRLKTKDECITKTDELLDVD